MRVFLDQAGHNVQLKLLRTDWWAKEDSGREADDLGKIRDIIRITIDVRFWASKISYVSHQARENALATHLGHSKKIEKLAYR